MRIRASELAAATSLSGLLLGSLSAAPLEREQFVAGWPIEMQEEGTFFDIPLTHDVYRTGRTLGELAVLDRTGEPMPFYRVGVAPPGVEERRTTLGVSPIYRRQEDDGASISVATDGGRTAVSVTRGDEAEPDAEVIAFIVDARDVEQTPTAIELEWQPLDRPFLMTVSIEHSESLTAWRSVGRGSVAALTIDSTAVTHREIPITGEDGGYYRIGWDRGIPEWQLERVTLVSSAQGAAAPLRTIELAAVAVPEELAVETALYFDAGGALPVTSIDLVFPGRNRWADASIHWAGVVEGPWRQAVSRRLFYDMDFEEERFVSQPVEVGRVEARYWRVAFDPRIPAETPTLALSYPAERLRFAANGEPPYILVGGTLTDQAGPDPTFAQVLSALDPDQVQVRQATLGEPIVLGGEAALEIPTEFPWQTALLWTALLIAGLTIGWMAVRLAREMTAKSTR